VKLEKLWDAKRCGRIPVLRENTLRAAKLTGAKYARILRQYEERQAEIRADLELTVKPQTGTASSAQGLTGATPHRSDLA
jgi:hypothetical protein